MISRKIGWGILGTAQIARKNWEAIRNSGNSIVVAVASRDSGRSRQFIKECQAQIPYEPAPQVLGSYEELLASKPVEAVYIPLPTGIRKEWVLRAAAAGKHVVCEKPCGLNVSDVREMLEGCRKHGVQFMDGVMFMHSRRLHRLHELLADGQSVGKIKRITTAFTFCGAEDFFSNNIRLHSDLEPHGCLGDLGWYCIRFTLWALNWQMPRQVSARLLAQRDRGDSPAPVPTELSAELVFSGGVSAGFYCSFLTENQQWALVSGTHGYVKLEDFVLPFAGSQICFEVQNAVFESRGCDFVMTSHLKRVVVPEYSHGHAAAQESNLFRNFSAQIQSGRLNGDWPEQALKTQIVLDACLAAARADDPVVALT